MPRPSSGTSASPRSAPPKSSKPTPMASATMRRSMPPALPSCRASWIAMSILGTAASPRSRSSISVPASRTAHDVRRTGRSRCCAPARSNRRAWRNPEYQCGATRRRRRRPDRRPTDRGRRARSIDLKSASARHGGRGLSIPNRRSPCRATPATHSSNGRAGRSPIARGAARARMDRAHLAADRGPLGDRLQLFGADAPLQLPGGGWRIPVAGNPDDIDTVPLRVGEADVALA